jgi:Tfp pilus assembly protein PilO
MNTGPDRKVVFALLGIAALCLIGLGASLYRAKTGELSRLRQDFAAKEKQYNDVQAKLTKQPELEAQSTKLQDRLSVLEPSLPDNTYMPTFLRQIERLAITTSNRIVSIKPKNKPSGPKGDAVKVNDETGEVMKPDTAAEKADDKGQKSKAAKDTKSRIPYDYSSIELKVDGTYGTILAFLAELQKFPKMIAANDISFTPKNGPGDQTQRSPDLTATMDLTAIITKGAKNGTS